MKQFIIVGLIIAVLTVSALAAAAPVAVWRNTLHSPVRACEDSDRESTGIAQGDVAKQAAISGIAKGTLSSGKKFSHADKCLNNRVLQEASCYENKSWWGQFKHVRGKFVQWYDVTCPTQCNPADLSHTAAWCN